MRSPVAVTFRICRPLFAVASVLAAGPVAAQSSVAAVRAPAARATAASSDAATLAAGWTALSNGNVAAAVGSADSILGRRPWDRSALLLKITALSATPARALSAYDLWLKANHPDEVGLLEPIAIGVLRVIAAGGDAELQSAAANALRDARVNPPPSGDAAADRLRADIDAARAGDVDAAQRLTGAASDPAQARQAPLARALARAGAAGEPALLRLLASPDSETRAAAAQSLGGVDSDAVRRALQQARQDSDPLVRTNATISLAQQGDAQALDAVDKMLASGVPDLQLAATDAWQGKPGPWVSVVRQLLDNKDGLTRIQAAQAIAPIDPEAARRVLVDALSDPNPVNRAESARAMAERIDDQPAVADLGALRNGLRDPDPVIRLQAASGLLRLARR